MKKLGIKTFFVVFLAMFALTLSSCSVDPVVGPQGDAGADGADGAKGDKGDTGDAGKSAYDLYCEAHPDYDGDEEQWLDDLLNGRLGNKDVHTVTFDSDGGHIVEPQLVYHGEKASKPHAKKPGYTFHGWYYDDDLWVFHGYPVTYDMTLVAKWSVNTYLVSFDLNGSEEVIDDVHYTYDEDVVLPVPAERLGFAFMGWMYEGSYVADGPWKIVGDVTLKAIWQVVVDDDLDGLAKLIYELDGGLASIDDLILVLNSIDEASEGINAADIQRMEGYDPRILVDPSQAFMEIVDGYGLIDGDAVEIGVEVDLRLAEPVGGGDYVLGEPFPYIDEVMTVWDDGDEVHLTNLAEGDVDDPYSFAVSADNENVDIDDFKVFVNSGNADEYLYYGEMAYNAFAGGDDFEVVTLVASIDKVISEDTGEYYLHLKFYTAGSWFGLYSAEAAWGPAYAGYYVDRAETWGFEAILGADGRFKVAYNYWDHFIETLYYDLNWEAGDPAPASSSAFRAEELDLVLEDEGFGFIYDVTMFVFYSLDGVEIVLPDIDEYREMDATDTTYFFDPVDYGFEIY